MCIRDSNITKYDSLVILQHDARSRQGYCWGNQLGNTLSFFLSVELPAPLQYNVGMPRGQEATRINTPPIKHIGNIVLGGRGEAQRAQVFPNWFPQP